MSTTKRDLDELRKLVGSRGWAYLEEVMKREVVMAAMQIADSPAMPLDEINFRRGAIWAAKQLLEMPNRLLLRLENELVMEKATKAEPSEASPTP